MRRRRPRRPRFTLSGPPLTAQEHAWLASFLHGWMARGICPPRRFPEAVDPLPQPSVSLGLTDR